MQDEHVASTAEDILNKYDISDSPTRRYHTSPRTQQILDRVNNMTKSRAYPPPARMPRVAPPPPTYYDYDYGYGGYGGYGGGYGGYSMPPPVPRYSRYDAYLDDEYEVPYHARFRARAQEPLEVLENEKPVTTEGAPEEKPGRVARRSRVPEAPVSAPLPESEGERHLARMNYRYPQQTESQALQEHVDKMRIKLKSLAYSLDPTGPVPEIVIPDRSKKPDESGKKYTPAVTYEELPKLSYRSRVPKYYPEDEFMKDNLRIRCLSQYKSTRTAAGYCREKLHEMKDMMPESYTSKYKSSTSKWEEPDTVYGQVSEKKPFSKVEGGTSFFSTYGYTNRKKDTVAEKDHASLSEPAPLFASSSTSSVRFHSSVKPEGDADDEARKERRKKKKSKEREELAALEAAVSSTGETEAVKESSDAPRASSTGPAADSSEGGTEEMDEKEKKRLEKKKRKAEREAAAKAAMEAELAALAEAEAELARLEAESVSLKPTPAGDSAESTTAKTEASSESATEK